MRAFRPHTWILLALPVSLPGVPTGLHGQEPDRVAVSSERLAHLGAGFAEFAPHSGPPGTVVKLRVRDLPPLAPLRVGIGALHMGFEEAGWVLSNDDGEFSTEIVIPEWGRNDAVHLFIVFDPYFNPIALTDVFHVTDENGHVRRAGQIERTTDGCTLLHGSDGVAYSLSGMLSGLSQGDSIQVDGTVATGETPCGTGTAIEVMSHQPQQRSR